MMEGDTMIYSNQRKLALSGWLRANHKEEYDNPFMLQKYLLFYECFSKVAGEKTDFEYLRGYERGPVFSQVWGDYTKERCEFDQKAEEAYQSGMYDINEIRAKRSGFMTGILTEQELSELTHTMNLWKSQSDRIQNGERQVTLYETDFNEDDALMISMLARMYPNEMIDDAYLVKVGQKRFIFHKSDVSRLTGQHRDTLFTLAERNDLFNPIYVEIGERGELVID